MRNDELRMSKGKMPNTRLLIKCTFCYTALILCCIVLAASCINNIDPPKNERMETETGTLSLALGSQNPGRTIMPLIGPDDFVAFALDFTPRNSGNTGFSETWGSSSGTVVLNVGTWDLLVTGYTESGNGGLLETAKGEIRNFAVSSGDNIAINIPLYPIAAGVGLFQWDISYPADVTYASMEITRLDEDAAPYCQTFYFIGYGDTFIGKNDNCSLDAGQYRVVFRLSMGGEEASASEILHIYKNLESCFAESFTYSHFPVSLLSVILGAWDTTLEEWKITESGITEEHFTHLGINGIDNNNLEGIINHLNALASAGPLPNSLSDLKVLVDMALIGITCENVNFIESGNYANQQRAEDAIRALPLNGAALDFVWGSDHATLTVQSGAHQIEVVFSGAVPLAFPTEITVAMWDSCGDGWDGAGALRINVNGNDISPNAKANGSGSNYYFSVFTGDIVSFYWIAGYNQHENAFAAYYSNDPPNPNFDPNSGNWSQSQHDHDGKVLVYRQYYTMDTISDGDLLGSFTVSLPYPALTGTVSISGAAQVGETLTAVTDNLDGSGEITYMWKRDGVNTTGADTSAYVVQTADIGSTITVTVSRAGYSSNVTSVPTAIIILPPVNQTPVADDFDIGNFTQTAGSVTAVTITPKLGKSTGAITVYYNGSTTLPTTAGTYIVTFDVAAATDWNAATGLVGGTLTINTMPVTDPTPVKDDFNIGNLLQTVGNVTPVTVSPKFGKSTGAITIRYDGSTVLPTAAGTYTITFDIAATPGWNAATWLVGGTLIIKHNPIPDDFDVSGAATYTYDGIVKTAAITPKAGKSTGTITIYYNSNTEAPKTAGMYTITVDIAETDTYFAAAGLEMGTITITPKTLTWAASGTVNSKTYDKTITATVASQPTLSGVIIGDTVTVTAGTATFNNQNAGTGIEVTAEGYGIDGTSAANYNAPISQPSFAHAAIVPMTLTWATSGTVNIKTYDRTTTAMVTAQPTLGGIITGDIITVAAGTAVFNSPSAGASVEVTATGYDIGGASAANYNAPVSQPLFANAAINAKTITITGVSATNRPYNGTVTVALTGGSLAGVITGDAVGFALGNGTIANASAGNNKAVTTTIQLTGSDKDNYALTQPSGITVNIAALESFSISFADFTDITKPTITAGILHLVGGAGRPTSANITMANPEQYDAGSIKWYFNNTLITTGISGNNGGTLTVSSTTYNGIRHYAITVEVEINNKPYSKVVTFEVRP